MRYNVHRSTTPGFTPSAANRIAQPTGTSYTDTGSTPGTYYYRVTAEDAAGNIGAALERGERDRDRGHRAADGAFGADRAGEREHREPELDRRRPTTSASSATTSTARRRPASRRARRTGSPSPPARPTATRARGRELLLQGRRGGRRRATSSAASNEATRGDRRRHDAADGPDRARGAGVSGSTVVADVDGGDRQRRRDAVQRPSVDDHGVHAERREPDRAADGDELQRRRARRPAPTTTR